MQEPAKHIDQDQLIDDHSDYLLSFAMSKLSDIDLAKDMVQDTFLSALTKLDSFEQRSSIRTWLTSILNRKIIDYWRKAETRYTDPISNFFNQDDPSKHWVLERLEDESFAAADQLMTRSETLQELSDCLDTLPDKWKGIMVAKYLEEKESEQICNDLAITSSNLWVMVHRAKLLLRDCLKSKWI